MAAGEQVIRAPAQLGTLLRGVRQQQGLSQQDLALKAGGTSQARLSQLELQPGRMSLTAKRLCLGDAQVRLDELIAQTPAVAGVVRSQLPPTFPAGVADPVLSGLEASATQLV